MTDVTSRDESKGWAPADLAAETKKRPTKPKWDWLKANDPVFARVRSERVVLAWAADAPALEVKYRELIAASILAARGMVSHCEQHLRYAAFLGLSKQELLEGIEAASVTGGSPILADLVPVLMKIDSDGGLTTVPGAERAKEDADRLALPETPRTPTPELAWLAKKDPAYFKAQIRFVDLAWTRPGRTLGTKYCELIMAVVLLARGMPSALVEDHLRSAMSAGMTMRELLEGLETAALPGGWPVMESALPILMKIESNP